MKNKIGGVKHASLETQTTRDTHSRVLQVWLVFYLLPETNKYEKSVKSVLYIFTFFSLTSFPVFAVVAFMLRREYISCLEVFTVYYIALVICFLSPSLNPALYGWRMNDIWNQVKNLFC